MKRRHPHTSGNLSDVRAVWRLDPGQLGAPAELDMKYGDELTVTVDAPVRLTLTPEKPGNAGVTVRCHLRRFIEPVLDETGKKP